MPASMHISVMLNQTCSASSSVHCCPCNMNIEKKKVYYCETKVGYWIQKHNWTVQTRMIFADTVIRNIVHIPFITVTEHITHECCWYRYEKWTANMFCMKKRTARKHSEMTDSTKRQRQKETDMCTHKKKETLYISCTSENEIICESVHTSVSFCLCHFAPFIISLCFKTN